VLYPTSGSKMIAFHAWINGVDRAVSVTPTALDLTQWHHYAGTYDPADQKLRLYIDGILQATSTAYSGTIAADSTGILCVGRDDGQTRYFDGFIDDVRVYSRSLSGPEILSDSLAGRLANGRFRLVPDSVNVLKDAGSDVVPVTVSGATWVNNDGPSVHFDGLDDVATLGNSSALHIDEGMTLCAAVRFEDTGTLSGQSNAHDMVLFKDGEFLLGRSVNSLYFNFCANSAWQAGVIAPITLESWHHVAATIRHEGANHVVKLYVDGVLKTTQTIAYVAPSSTTNAITVGQGWGGIWQMHGSIQSATMYNRALVASVVAALAATAIH
jgi:hypothetical protein